MPLDDQARADLLRTRLDARATGLWRFQGEVLALEGFSAAPDMPSDVAEGFANATRTIPLDRTELGVVRAALANGVAVSRAVELPPDVGSGYWLRAFGAERSVAVAISDESGRPCGVFSVALGASVPDDEAVVAVVRATALA